MKYNDEIVRLHAWQILPKLIKNNIIDLEDIKEMEKYYFELLNKGSLEAWLIAGDLYKERIITKPNMTKFLELLKGDPLDRIAAWGLVSQFIEVGLLNVNEIKDYNKYIIELLKYNEYYIRFNI